MNRFLLLLILFFSACELEKEIELNVPFEGQSLIILGSFSQAEGVIVELYKTVAPDAVPSNTVVDFAFVMLLENEKIVDTLLFDGEKYFSDFIPNEENAYQIKAVANGFPDAISTQQEIPSSVSINNISIVEDTTGVRLLVNIEATEASVGYYSLDADAYFGDNEILESTGKLEDDLLENPLCELFKKKIFNSHCLSESQNNILYKVGAQKLIINSNGTVDFKPFYRYKVKLWSYGEDYFKYIRNLEIIKESEADIFIETPLNFTNIKNGYGVFYGTNLDSLEIDR